MNWWCVPKRMMKILSISDNHFYNTLRLLHITLRNNNDPIGCVTDRESLHRLIEAKDWNRCMSNVPCLFEQALVKLNVVEECPNSYAWFGVRTDCRDNNPYGTCPKWEKDTTDKILGFTLGGILLALLGTLIYVMEVG